MRQLSHEMPCRYRWPGREDGRKLGGSLPNHHAAPHFARAHDEGLAAYRANAGAGDTYGSYRRRSCINDNALDPSADQIPSVKIRMNHGDEK